MTEADTLSRILGAPVHTATVGYYADHKGQRIHIEPTPDQWMCWSAHSRASYGETPALALGAYLRDDP